MLNVYNAKLGVDYLGVKLEELMKLPSLQGATVVAGKRALEKVYYVLSSIQFKYKILTNKIRLDCGTVLRSGRFLTHRHVSC